MALKSAKQHGKDKKLNTYHVQIQEVAILISSLQLCVTRYMKLYIHLPLLCPKLYRCTTTTGL